MQHNVNSSVP